MDRERPQTGHFMEKWQDEMTNPSEDFRQKVTEIAEMLGKPAPREGLSTAELKQYYEHLKKLGSQINLNNRNDSTK